MTYEERQAALAETPAGKLAIAMAPGTRWRRPKGDVVTIWMGWTPDLTGEAMRIAKLYAWPTPGLDHNSEIGITSARGTKRVNVASVGGWVRAS